MKILYVASYDAGDLASGNGTDFFKMLSLSNAGAQVSKLSPIEVRYRALARAQERFRRHLTGAPTVWHLTTSIQKQINQQILEHPDYSAVDIVLCPNWFDVGYYSGTKPFVVWSDATYANLETMYPGYTNAHPLNKKRGHYIQSRVLSRAAGGMWSSEYARLSAINAYGADPSKQAVVPFGLNFVERAEVDIGQIIAGRSDDQLNLLFIGFDFRRKGLDIALEAVEALSASGTRTMLSIVGVPKVDVARNSSHIKVYGKLDKRIPGDLEILQTLLKQSHLLILPTKADVSSMVAIEAMSFGCLPVVNDVGGVKEIVVDQESGIVLPVTSSNLDYARSIKAIWQDQARYHAMCRAAYDRYQAHFTWEKCADKAISFLDQIAKFPSAV